jgi:hypothetical protein
LLIFWCKGKQLAIALVGKVVYCHTLRKIIDYKIARIGIVV